MGRRSPLPQRCHPQMLPSGLACPAPGTPHGPHTWVKGQRSRVKLLCSPLCTCPQLTIVRLALPVGGVSQHPAPRTPPRCGRTPLADHTPHVPPAHSPGTPHHGKAHTRNRPIGFEGGCPCYLGDWQRSDLLRQCQGAGLTWVPRRSY